MRIGNLFLAFAGVGFVFSAPAGKKDKGRTAVTTTSSARGTRANAQTLTTSATGRGAVGRRTTTTAIAKGPTRKTTTSTTTSPSKVTTTTTVKTTASVVTTTATTPVSPTATPTKSSGKRGLAFNDPALTDFFSLSGQGSKVSWAYNWASSPYYGGSYTPNSYNSVLEYCPLLWSNATDLTSIWNSNVQTAIKTYGSSHILAFNEPDGCGGGSACMTVSSAVSAYQQYMQPYAGQLTLGAPAVTNAVGPSLGANYLSQFIGNCTGCTIDFIPFHWYGSVTDPSAFKTYVQGFYNQFKKPLWITEFGTSSGTEAQIVSFLQNVLPWLDQQTYVQRYAYFYDTNTGSPYLLNPNNTLTSIGTEYNSG